MIQRANVVDRQMRPERKLSALFLAITRHGRETMTHDSQARRIVFRKWVYYAAQRIRSKLQRAAHTSAPAASFRNCVRSRLNANRALSPPPIMAGSWWKLALLSTEILGFRTEVKSVLTTRILLLLLA